MIAKEPVPGRVKTRLCPPCTESQAAAIAEAALADTLAAATASGADRIVLSLDGRPGPWCPPGVEVLDQGSGDLAARLATTWRAARGPALQIGMDTPQVSAEDLAGVMARLEAPLVDAVLGLALDGGWWALGLHEPRGDLFAGVRTSRPDTGQRQLDRMVGLGLRVRRLPPRRDVDTWADAEAVAFEVPDGRFAAAVKAASA